MRCLAIYLSLLCLSLPVTTEARPVSYPDGWTLNLRNDRIQNSALAHYTLDTEHAIGARLRYDRDGDFIFVGAQLNRLIKRWNRPSSQANIYGRIALGKVFDDASGPLKRDDDEALFLGVSGDWETRRYFASVTAEHWENGRFGEFSNFHARLGIAPYVANTGAIHTWLMVEGYNRPESLSLIHI